MSGIQIGFPAGRPIGPGDLQSVGVSLAEHRKVLAELGSALSRLAVLEGVEAEREQLAKQFANAESLADAAESALRAELASARQELELLRHRPQLPATEDEIRQWYADHDLNLSCGPAVLFAALRRYLNQPEAAGQ